MGHDNVSGVADDEDYLRYLGKGGQGAAYAITTGIRLSHCNEYNRSKTSSIGNETLVIKLPLAELTQQWENGESKREWLFERIVKGQQNQKGMRNQSIVLYCSEASSAGFLCFCLARSKTSPPCECCLLSAIQMTLFFCVSRLRFCHLLELVNP